MDSPIVEEGRLKEIGSEACSCLSWILKEMGMDAEVELFHSDNQVLLNVCCGEDSNLLIGRKGQTLEALQTIVTRITARKFPEVADPVRILVDIEGYRDRRRASLIDMALRAGEEARESGEPVLLDPLNSYERYLVHTALKEEQGIDTRSEGVGTFKQIVVSPSGEGNR
jgi:spoIIIJ-associated protein